MPAIMENGRAMNICQYCAFRSTSATIKLAAIAAEIHGEDYLTKLRTATLAALTCASLVATLPPTAPAAAASCSRTGCNGKMASANGCITGAYAISSFSRVDGNDPDGTVAHGDLYYSPACGAMWGDYTATYFADGSTVRLDWQPTYGGLTQTAASLSVNGSGNYVTTMFSWEYSLQLCASSPSGNPEGNETCTAWR
ncbi:hypothetical protein AB0C22_19075 [Micromonospora sp. NPDC048894]|uniref:hypothetical protein n=1 Tax=Micromonospora sp. NPDC048894 TaxID=3155493 RepID=UPI0033D97134